METGVRRACQVDDKDAGRRGNGKRDGLDVEEGYDSWTWFQRASTTFASSLPVAVPWYAGRSMVLQLVYGTDVIRTVQCQA